MRGCSMPWALPLLPPPVLQCLCWDEPLVPAQAQKGALQGPLILGSVRALAPPPSGRPVQPRRAGKVCGAGSACCSPGQPCLRWSIFTSRASRCTARCGFITLTRETAPCCEHSPAKGSTAAGLVQGSGVLWGEPPPCWQPRVQQAGGCRAARSGDVPLAGSGNASCAAGCAQALT